MALKLPPSPFIIAHRGYSVKYPENTLVAFVAAHESGAKVIELDIQLSKDRKIFVLHDETLDRTTNGKGIAADFTLEELQLLDAGSWFHPKFEAEQIPTLEQVLVAVGTKVMVNIEIKSEALEQEKTPDSITKQLVTLVRRLQLQDQVIISSFEPKLLAQVRDLDSNLALAVLSESAFDKTQLQLLSDLGAMSWNPDAAKVTLKEIRHVKELGYQVLAYTVNQQHQALQLFEAGVDGLFSNHVTLI